VHRASLTFATFTWACSPTKANVGSDYTAGPMTTPISEDGDDTEAEAPISGDEDPGDDSDSEDDPPRDTARWTVMVYLNGDNNLEINAVVDMNEMEQVGSTDDVHLLVQLDRSTRYTDTDGAWSGARRYRAEQDFDMDHITSPVLEDLGSIDSGAVDTFIEFAEWGVENYPAERYAYVIWDHGWGWTAVPGTERKGVSEDEQTGSEISVANGELEEIFAGVTDAMGDKMALVGMDACLMATWEVATVAAPYADYFVGSQATESVDGWAYHTTYADLVADPEMDAAELGTVIAQRFYETRDSTQSVVNLTDLDHLNDAIDGLAQAIMSDESPRDALVSYAREAQDFDGDMPDLDLGDLSTLLEEESDSDDISIAATSLRDELDGLVVANFTYGSRFRNATGLSIYLPTRHGVNDSYLDASWAPLTQWDEMISEIQN